MSGTLLEGTNSEPNADTAEAVEADGVVDLDLDLGLVVGHHPDRGTRDRTLVRM